MTQKNMVPNGDFSTGDFSEWIPQGYDTPMSVERHNGSYAARLVGGRNQGQSLATKTFHIQPGVFAFSSRIQAPNAAPLQDTKDRRIHIPVLSKTPNPMFHAHIYCTLWTTNRNTGEHEVWPEVRYVDPQTRTLTLKGTIRPGYEWLSVHFAIPNDPFGNKGHYLISKVWFSVV
ncbi:hypothetical protein [Pseudomonas sp. 58(2021)]|uniref:hypothetical protein n=1 Tax=Pseudomonas sp. 58(2021) TaxID=2813330 RepID=UPI001A9D45E8|nr:hypothetical protein [Pseudomonas sp. 58(2021)]